MAHGLDIFLAVSRGIRYSNSHINCNRIFLSQMDTKTANQIRRRKQGFEETYNRLRNKVRSFFERGSTEERASIRKNDRDVQAQLDRLKKLEERRDRANAKLLEVIGKPYTEELFLSGEVDRIFVEPGDLIKLAEGWTAKLIYSDKVKEKFMVFFNEGCVLPMHNHVQRETVDMKFGRCKVSLKKPGKPIETHVVQMDSKLEIDPLVNHRFTALEDGELIVTFEPPLVSKSKYLHHATK